MMSRVFLVGAALMALLAAACSGDDGGSEDGDAAATMTAAATTVATVDATAAATIEATGEPGGGGSSGSPGTDLLGSQECRDAAVAVAEAFQFSAMGFAGVTDEQLSELEDALNAAGADAPDEIRADLAVFAAAWAEFAEAIQESGWDPSSGQAPPAVIVTALESFGSAEVEAASERLGAWFEGNCQD